MSGAYTTPARKALTFESIQKKALKAAEKGLLTYWKASDPSKGGQQISTGIAVARAKHAARPAHDRWVFFPDLRIVGPVSEIVRVLREAQLPNVSVGQLYQITNGQAGNPSAQAPISEEVIRNNSLDPLNPQHAAIITAFVDAVKQQSGKKVKAPKAHYDLAAKTDALRQAKAALKGTTSTSVTSGAKGAKAGKGNKADTNRQNYVADFESKMDALLAGRVLEKVAEVSKFDATKFTGVHPKPPPGERATARRPIIDVQGRMVQLPFIAQPSHLDAMLSYIQNVVAHSKYAQYAGAMTASVNNLRGGAVSSVAAPVLSVAPLMSAPVAVQPMSLPTMGLPTLAKSPVSGFVSPAAQAGASSPRLPTLQTLPTLGGVGGFSLPTLQ